MRTRAHIAFDIEYPDELSLREGVVFWLAEQHLRAAAEHPDRSMGLAPFQAIDMAMRSQGFTDNRVRRIRVLKCLVERNDPRRRARTSEPMIVD